jgi:hypothetical protein
VTKRTEIDNPRYWHGLAKKTRSIAENAHPDATPILIEIARNCEELGRRAQERARRARLH